MLRLFTGMTLVASMVAMLLGGCFKPTFTTDQPFTCRTDDWCPEHFSCVSSTGGKVCRRDCASNADCKEPGSVCQQKVCVPQGHADGSLDSSLDSSTDGLTTVDGATPRVDATTPPVVCTEPERVDTIMTGPRTFDLVIGSGVIYLVSLDVSGGLQLRRAEGASLPEGGTPPWTIMAPPWLNMPAGNGLVAAAVDGQNELHLATAPLPNIGGTSTLYYCRPVFGSEQAACSKPTSALGIGTASIAKVFDLDLDIDITGSNAWLALAWQSSVTTQKSEVTLLRRNSGEVGFSKVCTDEYFLLDKDERAAQALRLDAAGGPYAALSACAPIGAQPGWPPHWFAARFADYALAPACPAAGRILLDLPDAPYPAPAAVLGISGDVFVATVEPGNGVITCRPFTDPGDGLLALPAEIALVQEGLFPFTVALARLPEQLPLVAALAPGQVVVAVRGSKGGSLGAASWERLPLAVSNGAPIAVDDASTARIAIDATTGTLHIAYDGPDLEGMNSRALYHMTCPLQQVAPASPR